MSPSLNASSPAFSASKSYRAWQQGPLLTGVRAGERTGDGRGDAETKQNKTMLLDLARKQIQLTIVRAGAIVR